jgi:hypothetical protein
MGKGFGPGGKGSCPCAFFLIKLLAITIAARRATIKAPYVRLIVRFSGNVGR